MTSDLRPAGSPPAVASRRRDRVEARDPMPLQRGRCDWCGSKTKGGASYCAPPCRVAYNNLLARQGKAVMQLLKVWRQHRGGKGTPGEGKLTAVAARVDAFLDEDRARKRGMQGE